MTRIALPVRRRLLKSAAGVAALFLPQPYAWVWAQSDGTIKLLRAPKQALVIGNSRYAMSPLANPANDARAMSTVLQGAGFDVTTRLDAVYSDLAKAVQDYTQTLSKRQAVGVFYYAGHGLQLGWRNYMMPVDANLREAGDVSRRCVELGDLLKGIAGAKNPLNVIILDACRNNPFGNLMGLDQKGLSQMDAPASTLLAYATAPGNVASDGEGANGLYTENLVREMRVADAKLEDVFKRVRLHVRLHTKGQQIPWESTSLEEDYYIVPPKALTSKAAEEAERERREVLARLERQRQAEEAERQRRLEEARRVAQLEADAAERKRKEEQAALEAKRAAEEAERRYQEELALIAKRAEEARQKDLQSTIVRKPSKQELEREFAAELALWERTKTSKGTGLLEDYLRRYPDGKFSELAQFQLDRLLAAQGEKKIEIASQQNNPFTSGTMRVDTKFRVGDSYQYQEIDRFTQLVRIGGKRTITEITDSQVHFQNGNIYDLLGNRIKGAYTWENEQTCISEYSLGKRWTTRYSITAADGAKATGEEEYRVVARELVKVPAGSFDAFRIEGKGYINWGPPRRPTVHTSSRWVAPEIRMVIAYELYSQSTGGGSKVIYNFRRELVSYNQQA